jgi:hypothetical protein
MNDHLQSLLADLDAVVGLNANERAACGERTVWLQTATGDEVQELLRECQLRPAPADRSEQTLLGIALGQLVRRSRQAPGDAEEADTGLQDEVCAEVVGLYRHWGAASHVRHLLLAWLAASRRRAALATLADLLAESPPRDALAVATALSPLFQRQDYDPAALFPRLLDGLEHGSAAAGILDLANFVTRQKLLPRHPAADRVASLASLLGGVVGRLGQLESSLGEVAGPAAALAQQVNEGVSLGVAVCDALAQIGDPAVVGKLYQALELRHRRLRVEAAAALARLGEASGADALVALAAEAVVRLRVLAYAEELGLLDRVDEAYRTELACQEAELVLWLAQPSQAGFPPSRCEWIESRELYWPGYDEPRTCSLFRFTYRRGDQEFSNVGIVGPLVHAFGADLLDLPPDDIFAAFAGWQAEHEEIYELDVAQLDELQRLDVYRLERRLRDDGCDAVQPLRLAFFFGEKALLARATRRGQPGVAVADAHKICWWPHAATRRPLGPDEAWCIYKGRHLLRTFNPES